MRIRHFCTLCLAFFSLSACGNAFQSPVKQPNSENTTIPPPTPAAPVPAKANFNPENLLVYQKAKISEQLALINSLKTSIGSIFSRSGSTDFILNMPRPFELMENASNVEWEEFDAATADYMGEMEKFLTANYKETDGAKIQSLVQMAKKTWGIISQQLRSDFSEYNKTQAKNFILDLHTNALHIILQNKKLDIRYDKFDILFSPAETPLVVGQPFYIDLGLAALSSQAKLKIAVNGKNIKANADNISIYSFTPTNTNPQTIEVSSSLENPITGKIFTVKKTYIYQPVVAE